MGKVNIVAIAADAVNGVQTVVADTFEHAIEKISSAAKSKLC